MENFQKYWSQNVGQDFIVLEFFVGGISCGRKRCVREINVSCAWDPVHAGDKALTRETPAKRGRVNRYEVVHHLITVPVYHHPTMAEITSTRHSHAWKFQTIRTNINIYKYSFFPRTIILWNQLPPPVIAVPDLDAFKVAVKGVF